MAMNAYMVIEHFRGGKAKPVYERFRERGRLAPDGLVYVASWVDEGLSPRPPHGYCRRLKGARLES